MRYWIGYLGNRIKCVSTTKCNFSEELSILSVDIPDCVASKDLLTDYKIRGDQVVKRTQSLPYSQLRVALVGVYRIQCGISTYAEQMFPRIADKVSECKIFAEHAEAPQEPNVIRCWTRGEPLTELVARIKEFNPDVVYVEHEFGIFPDARHWLAFVSQMQEFRLIIKQHSIFSHRDKTICEAAVPEIIVHSEAGRRVLLEKGFGGKVYVVFHGCTPCTNRERLWNLYQSQHTLVQFGFGFQYKGWENALGAVAILKEKYPDIFYTGLFSESKFNLTFHANYHQQLTTLVKELGIEENVALIRGYQGDLTLDSYLRTNRVAIFPYVPNGVHTVYGATGAARVAMTASIPTIVSDVPQFDDLEGTCPRPGNEQEIADEVERFFNSKEAVAQQLARQEKFLSENSWDNVVHRHLEIFSSSI